MTHDTFIHVHRPDPPSDGKYSWTEDRIALLTKLRADGGLKRCEIADRINKETGSKFTMASICGKIDRLFPTADPLRTEEEKVAIKREQRKRWNETKRRKNRAKRIAAGLPVDMNRNRPAEKKFAPEPFLCQEAVDIIPRNLTLMQLEAENCHYPYGDDPAEMVFCGNPVFKFELNGTPRQSSYCRSHHMICTRPPQAPKRPPYIEFGKSHGGVFGRAA